MELDRSGVVGAGSFGTAIAQALRTPVVLWGRDPEVIESINSKNQNSKYFPGIALKRDVYGTCNMREVEACSIIFICVPAAATRVVCRLIGNKYKGIIVICSKGIEDSGSLMHEVVAEANPAAEIAVLSGPNFAQDLVKEESCITTVATYNQKPFRDLFQENVEVDFRKDLVGVEICSVFKNILALACGLAQGGGINLSTQAAVMFKGFQAMEKLLQQKGGDIETLKSPAGLGDLWLTTLGPTSRNYKMGVNLVQNQEDSSFLSEGLLSVAVLAKSCRFCSFLWNVVQKLSREESIEERKFIVREELSKL